MLDIFSGLRLVVKRRTISIDNAIFRCHWFFTSTLLISFSLIITARQYVGQPIECHSVNKLPDSLLNSYCWVQSTFTVPQACNKQVDLEVPYPCIDNTRGREIKMFAYYQWVGIVLFIQGLMFHLPYYLWKVWENGLIKAITGGLRVAVLNDQERNKKKEIVVDYIHDHLGCHKRYAFKYFLCEFICLINLLLQLWATNKFFDGQFLRYGLDVIHYSSTSISGQFGATTTYHPNESIKEAALKSINNTSTQISPKRTTFRQVSNQQQVTVDPMTYIFPRITKCTYYDFGSSGDIQKHDALCLLPLNIINEKIYIALWFWFIILGFLTLLVIFYRLFAVISENVRCKGLISRCKLSCERDIRIICRHCDVGDWFLFYMVAENLDPLIMREIIAIIASKIRAHFDLKRELGMIVSEDSLSSGYEEDSLYKFRDNHRSSQISTSFPFDQQSQSFFTSNQTRTDSIVPNAQTLQPAPETSDESLPLVKRVKKHLYNKRLWSVDLSTIVSGIIPQSLISNGSGCSTSNQETHLHHHHQQQQQQHRPSQDLTYRPSLMRDTTTLEHHHVISSAPPASQMPLDSSNLAAFRGRRRSLTRSTSSGSGDSFILEMQNVSRSRQDLINNNNTNVRISPGINHLHRRFSQTTQSSDSGFSSTSSTRPKLMRQSSVRSQREVVSNSPRANRQFAPLSAQNILNRANNNDNEIQILQV